MKTDQHKKAKSTAPGGSKGMTKHNAKTKVIGQHGGSAEDTDVAKDADDYTGLTHGSGAERRSLPTQPMQNTVPVKR